MATDLGGDSSFTVSAEQAVGPYFRAVGRHWKLVALITVLAVIAAGAVVLKVGSSYSSNASILVTPLPEGDTAFVGIGSVVETGDPARTLQTAAALVDTPDAAALAAKRLGPPWTTSSVSSAVSVAPEGASDVLSITAQASHPTDARRLANAYAEGAVAYRASVVQPEITATIAALENRLAQIPTTQVSSSPEAASIANSIEQLRAAQGSGKEPTLSVSQSAQPGSRGGASRPLVLFLALVGGFALASVTALALELFSRPVRDREEILSLYPIPILAALPLVSAKRGRHGTPPWALPAAVFEQLRMLRVQLSMSTKGPVIMVTSAGAGDGKTTVVAALAAAFAEADQSVILLDLDLRKPDLRRLLGVDAVEHPALPAAAPPGVPIEVSELPGVRVFPTPRGDMTTVEMLVRRLPLLISEARKAADVVIIDTAPVGEVSEALQIAGICDEVVFVARPRHTDRRRLILARDLLERAQVAPIGMVLVGKETGLPRGDQGYAYSVSMGGSTNGVQKSKPKRRQASASEADVAADRTRD